MNLLEDGSLIDLCGATLLWRSAEGLSKGPVNQPKGITSLSATYLMLPNIAWYHSRTNEGNWFTNFS